VCLSLIVTLGYAKGALQRENQKSLNIVDGDSEGLSRSKRFAGGRVPLSYLNVALANPHRNALPTHFRNSKRFR